MPDFKSSLYCGIDVGANGGIAFLSTDKSFAEVHKMPEDRYDLVRLLAEYPIMTAVIEELNSSPQMGVNAAFTFGRNYERPLAICSSLHIRVVQVRPKQWQRALGMASGKTGSKRKIVDERGGDLPIMSTAELKEFDQATLRARNERVRNHKHNLKTLAETLFPSLRLTLSTCDSILLAEYGRRAGI